MYLTEMWSLPLILGLTGPVTACALHAENTCAGDPHHRRWFGISQIPSDGTFAAPYFYPWKATCDDPMIMPVRYCFKDDRSAKNLDPIVSEAVARWSPAWSDGSHELSALRIIPDAGCGDAEICLCSNPGVTRDALMISDETKDNDPEWNDGPDCDTVTTTGYKYIPEGEANTPFRHYLKFCSFDPTDNNRQKDRAVLVMMHELGHAIGLAHEHQKPNRDEHLWYQIKNIQGYEAALEEVRVDELGYFEDEQSLDHRIKRTARNGHIAKSYFPQAVDYAMSTSFAEGYDETAAMYASFPASSKFDYESIMMYNSDTGATAKGKRIIFRKDNKGSVYMGGNPDVTKAGISEGDVARVAMLYDAKTEAGERAKMGEIWGEAGSGPSRLKVKIRGTGFGLVRTPGWKAVRKMDEL